MFFRQRTRHQLPAGRPQDRRSRGQAMVEFALVLPIMLVMLLLAVDFGRLFYPYISVHNAAREGAFYAAINAGDEGHDADAFAAAVAAAAAAQANSQTQGNEGPMVVTTPSCFSAATSVSVRCDLAGDYATGIGNQVSVGVSQDFTFATPLIGDLFGGNLPVSVIATAPVLDRPGITVTPDAAATPTATPFATPTATPTATAGATADPTATPTAAPTATPTCTVPNFFNTYFADPDALLTWDDAGFTGALIDTTGGKKIRSQTIVAGSSVDCTSSMTVDDTN